MRIVYSIPRLSTSGGVERVTSIKANWLVNHGYDVDIICKENGAKSFFSYDSKVTLHGINSPLLKAMPQFLLGYSLNNIPLIHTLLWRYRSWREKRAYLKLFRTLNPDIIIAQSGDFNLTEAMLQYRDSCHKKGKRDVRIILEAHEYRYYYDILTGVPPGSSPPYPLPLSICKTLYKKIGGSIQDRTINDQIKSLDSFITLTQEDAQNYSFNNLRVIPNPLTLPPLTTERNNELRHQREKRLIAVGRCSKQKNLEAMIHAWRILSTKHPDWSLYIFGSEVPKLLQHEAKGVERIYLKDATQKIDEELLKSSIFVMTSIYEGLPLVLLEAQALGLPIVSFSCPCGPRDIITDGVNGFLVEVNNQEGLVSRLDTLMSDEHLITMMSQEALLASQRYNIDKVMKQWDNLFKMKAKNNVE